jgi:Ion channel
MKSLYDHFVDFWTTDRSLTGLLLLSILSVLIVPSFTAADTTQRPLLDLLLTLALIAGIRIIYKDRTKVVLLIGFVMLAVLIRLVCYLTSGQLAIILRAIANIVSLIILAVVVMYQIFREGPITMQRVQGAVAEYLLLGLIWASIYELLELLIPGSIQNISTAVGRNTLPSNAIYFSFMTLTTVGYGDFIPVHHLARSLAILEALTGQLFPAILIARLVSMELYYSSNRKRS